MTILFGIIGFIVTFVLLVLYSAFVWGFITYKFYYWFLLPVFPELPDIIYHHAIALHLFISLFNKNYYIDNDNNNTEKTITGLIIPWMILLIGYVTLQFLSL